MNLDLSLVLSVVGFFGTTALTINAFFLRGIFQDLNAVKIEIAKISVNSDAKETRIRDLEANQKELYNKINDINEKIHSVEGAQKQVLKYLEEKDS